MEAIMTFNPKQQKKITDFIQQNRLKIDYKKNAQWSNFCKTVNPKDVMVLNVHDLASAQQLLKKIYDINKVRDPEYRITCRVAAGGVAGEQYSNSFSLSPLVSRLDEDEDSPPTDIIIHMNLDPNLEAMDLVDETTVRIRPGPQIKALDETLYYKYGLQTKSPASLINRVTPFGLAAVGGHGADINSGGYSDNIKSLTFLLMDGTLKKITRETNPDDFDLIASAHLGLFGIVVEMELECKPATKLECVETPMSLPEFLEQLERGEFPCEGYSRFSVFYTPTQDNDLRNRDIKNVKVMQYKEVPLTTENRNFSEMDLLSRRIQQALEINLEGGLRVTDLLALYPQLVPLYMKYIVARYAIGTEQKVMVGDAPEIYHYQEWYPNDINDVDAMFPVSENYQEMAAAFIKVAEETQTAKERGEAPVTFGAYARLVKNMKYQFSLAPGSHHSDKDLVCGFDVVSSPGAKGFDDFRDNLVNYLIKEFQAKLHWGKYIPLNKGIDYNKMYEGDMDKFNAVLRSWHRKNHLDISRSPFLTAFPCQLLGMRHLMPAHEFKHVVSTAKALPQSTLLTDKIFAALTNFVAQFEGQKVEEHYALHHEALRQGVQEIHRLETEKRSGRKNFGFFTNAFSSLTGCKVPNTPLVQPHQGIACS